MNINTRFIIIVLFVVVIIILLPYIFVFSGNGISDQVIDWSNMSTYISGLIVPVLAALNLFVLLRVSNDVGKMSNREDKHREIIRNVKDKSLIPEYKVDINLDDTVIDNWEKIEKLHKKLNEILLELSISDKKCVNDLKILLNKSGQSYIKIEKKVSNYENPFIDRNFEIHNIGLQNIKKDITIQMLQLKKNIYKLLLENQPSNETYLSKFKKSLKELEKYFSDAYYAD